MSDYLAISVDLEPNKDGSIDDVAEAMEWYQKTVECGTVYATYRIATEMPDLIDRLATDHEIGVHVHPREFGHDHDQFAELPRDRQHELISDTRQALTHAADLDQSAVTVFRAGRHSASKTTFDVLEALDFNVDASVNIHYTAYLPSEITTHPAPFDITTDLSELPTTYNRPPLFSRLGLRAFPDQPVTATANTLRTDKRGTTGLDALRWLMDTSAFMSFYMHPYDASGYHSDVPNSGVMFRQRFETLIRDSSETFLTASEVIRQEST